MSNILAFDVSNNSCSVAISCGQNILAFEQEMRPSMQAERLIPMIEQALYSADMSYKDLNYLAVTNGPGSFTGIRIGLAAAKGILLGNINIKGFAISNFEMSYYRAVEQYKKYDKIAILINAYRNQLYFQFFDRNGKQSLPQLIDVDKALDILVNLGDKVVCAGSGLLPIYERIRVFTNLILLPRFTTIKAIHICKYADKKIRNNSMQAIEPLYIRLPDAIPPKN
jgi:tRNA threonylcarbamoyladenosine biosynthesis protein TsaB